MKSQIKFLAAASVLLTVAAVSNAQTADSLGTTSGNTINVQSESVMIVDTNATPTVTYYSGSTDTETIRIYSGSHSGNNISRTIEVPLPADSPRRYKPY